MKAGQVFRSRTAKVVAIAAGLGLALWAAPKAWHAYQLNSQVQQIAVLSGLRSTADFSEKIEALRAFINDNSQHNQDAEFYATWRQSDVLATRLVNRAKDKNQPPVHLECSTRTALMTWALEAAGYTTRRVDIYDAATLKSHTFLDVLNPQTGLWETQDPDYDISWRARASGRRVSIAQLAGDLDAVEPCGRTDCGWQVASRERFKAAKLKDYLDYISVKSPDRRYTLYTPRADAKEVHTLQENSSPLNSGLQNSGAQKSGRFCELFAENCRDGFFDVKTRTTQPN